MEEQIRQQLATAAADFHLPRYNELPDMGLYLEQVIRYVGRYVYAPLTGSMVSNYVKQKTIPGPNKKAYDRDSIAYLIFVSYIKTVLSMEDIRLMIDIQRHSYSLEVAYDYFCDEFENLLQYVSGLKEQPDQIGTTATEEKFLLRTALMSITYKVFLDQYMQIIRQIKAAAGDRVQEPQ